MKIEINLLNSQTPDEVFLIEEEHYNDIVLFQSLFLNDNLGREAAYCYLCNADFRPAVPIAVELLALIPKHPDTLEWERLIAKYPAMQGTVYEFLVDTKEGKQWRAFALLGQKSTIQKLENTFIKPVWNKHVEEFANSYLYALEAVCAKLVGATSGQGKHVYLSMLIFNSIVLQGEEYCYHFLKTYMELNNLNRIWLDDLCPEISQSYKSKS